MHTTPFKNLNKLWNFVILKEILGKKGQVGNYFQNNENDLVILLEKHGEILVGKILEVCQSGKVGTLNSSNCELAFL